MADFQERSEQAATRARELEGQMSDPEVARQAGKMQQIAKELDIRVQTVKNHVASLMEKLNMANRLEVGLLGARLHVQTKPD